MAGSGVEACHTPCVTNWNPSVCSSMRNPMVRGSWLSGGVATCSWANAGGQLQKLAATKAKPTNFSLIVDSFSSRIA